MAGVKKEERREDRKFVAFPPETVQIIGESVGVPNVAPAVAAALSEDASYRARELAHVSVSKDSVNGACYNCLPSIDFRSAASYFGTARGKSSPQRT